MKRRPTHPGELLREDFLPDYGLTVSGFAKALGVSRRTVTELLHERRSVSTRMALFLSRFFGTSPEFWLNAQRAVDLWDALKSNRKKIDRIIPVNLLGSRKEDDPLFLKRIAAARKSLRSGKGIRLEDCRMRSEYDFKSGVRGKYAKRYAREGSVANERDAKVIEHNSKRLNKEAHDVLKYQVPVSNYDRRKRLVRECEKIDPRVEKALAEEGMYVPSWGEKRHIHTDSIRSENARKGWAKRFRDAVRNEDAAEHLEKRAAKGSQRRFGQAMKKVRNVKPARKDVL